MHKTKKKIKTADKLPKPIKIKKEKTEEDRSLRPISHYIDDRLELVKQIFGTLKPKTITNLAPDFLKKKSMEEIQELCLNELLCISTKRLLSIMNATKCPTDTESSSDSDVQHKEEHISLEEISSDSEIEGASSSKAKKKSNNTGNGNVATKKNAKNSTENEENDGQVSVLELLELQARARAIRSQLALEPVTKIEVNSDEEVRQDTKKFKKDKKEKRTERKRELSETENQTKSGNSSSTKHINENGAIAAEKLTSNDELEQHGAKKIKLKRNYRTSNQESDALETTNAAEVKKISDDVTSEASSSKEMKRERKSPSPDVIPIIAEPETLLISDSSDKEDEDMHKKENNEKNSHTKTVDKTNESTERKMRRGIETVELLKKTNESTEKKMRKGTEELPNKTNESTERKMPRSTETLELLNKTNESAERKMRKGSETAELPNKTNESTERKMRKDTEIVGLPNKTNESTERKMRRGTETVELPNKTNESTERKMRRSTETLELLNKTNKSAERKKRRGTETVELPNKTNESTERKMRKGTETVEFPNKTNESTERKMRRGTESVELPNKTNESTERKRRRSTETEEGEISDTETDNNITDLGENVATNTSNVNQVKDANGNAKEQGEGNVLAKTDDKESSQTSIVEQKSKTSKDFEISSNSENYIPTAAADGDTKEGIQLQEIVTKKEVTMRENVNANMKNLDEYENKDIDDDDQNDDVISIEGGDLETEMIEHLEDDNNAKSSFAQIKTEKEPDSKEQKQQKDADIISLDSSEDEREKESRDSWHARYLRSSKVSKVLAASRLGKRVRDKIKKSKHTKKQIMHEAAQNEIEKAMKQVFTSKHEDGSVEQYKELLEMRQRKT